ncbi:DNA-binding response regulator [Marinomonas sp. UCMA 3892]|uniref:response regulator n=1 Tax=unclassified Marinomonas TaxID=196814 RepID=UPI0006621622|nr:MULTISPECIES: response regulator transcription factor [unclassified Marinomonas]MBU1294860.1 response regulator transcription factor [Gammaproteobacteria bacterium]MBU1468260.1 response regulator transcription factor [Gammaproteobacteria bacterium]MBU2022108.1 response regulator transcription factor [Gammaproteobacteria bacterium]MBU2236681.1 response regulator transcription factor [Gammaproteobacteria bacterium]MBU2317720.1 response regulator transcription factor [Gammaproteobacteria bacte
MRILVVEDDLSLADGLVTALKREGYTVDLLHDGIHALEALANEVFDLVVLDLGLPRLDGLAVLKQLRANENAVPVLILTARDALEDRVAGLDLGADDYLVKPFDVTELKARARALLRRSYGRAISEIHYKGLVLFPASHKVTYQDKDVNLTRREYSLLHELVSQPGHVFTRDVLQQLMYGWGDDVESNALEVHIHHLRKKLFPELIRTIRGIGYVVDQEVG